METPSTTILRPADDPLAKFRRLASPEKHKALPLSQRERYVLWAVAPLILLNPWHAGSMLWWSNLANLGLALLPVLAAFIPLARRYEDAVPSDTPGQVLKKLICFPFFWIGLLFLGYIVIQALNYSWEFMWTENKRGFYMQQRHPDEYIAWLPSGMKTPFKMTNAWQALLMWGVPWIAACAMWSTFRRRKCWRIVLWMISTVGVLLAVLGVVAQITAPDKIFWIWDAHRAGPFGPFTYRNQASVLLYMGIAASFALYFYYQRSARSHSGLQLLPLLMGLISFSGSVMSLSRAGWIGTGVIMLAGIALFVIQLLWQRDYTWKLMLLQVTMLIALLAGIGYFLSKTDLSLITTKWDKLSQSLNEGIESDRSLYMRQLVAKKTITMFEDNPVVGWGANSFRFYFPVYQQEDEWLIYLNFKGRLLYNKKLFWSHAHSDWVQFLAEYGIIGCTLLLSGLFYWWGSLLRYLRSLRCEHWILLCATLTAVAQAFLDIVFYNPTLLIFFMLLLICARGTVQPAKS